MRYDDQAARRRQLSSGPLGSRMNNNKFKEALAYWRIGLEYFHIVQSVVGETIKQGNIFIVIMSEPISEDTFEQETKWSDHNLIIPVLFDFYHGLEVVLKGFIIASEHPFEKTHRLSNLLSDFEVYFPNQSLATLAGKYIKQGQLPNILASFCVDNGMTIDDYYQALKYPESTTGSIYQHDILKNRGELGLPFFKELVADVEKIMIETVALGRSLQSAA
jgi:hypothetical protein